MGDILHVGSVVILLEFQVSIYEYVLFFRGPMESRGNYRLGPAATNVLAFHNETIECFNSTS